MKIKALSVCLLFIYGTICCQKTNTEDKKEEKIKTEQRLTVNGWWKITNKEYFYYEDSTQNLQKWDLLDKDKRILISDSLVMFFTPFNYLHVDESPNIIYKQLKEANTSEYFHKFPKECLKANIIFKRYYDSTETFAHNLEYRSYYDIYVLNDQHIVLFSDVEIYFLDRINNYTSNTGWDIMEGYNYFDTDFRNPKRLNPHISPTSLAFSKSDLQKYKYLEICVETKESVLDNYFFNLETRDLGLKHPVPMEKITFESFKNVKKERLVTYVNTSDLETEMLINWSESIGKVRFMWKFVNEKK